MTEFTVEDFYNELRQNVLAGSEARQDFLESEYLLSLAKEMEDSGVIEGFEPCHYKAVRGMRVDGYWFKEEEASLDLFVMDFANREALESLTSTEVQSSFKRLENFFIGSIDKKLYADMEETSPGYGLSRDISDRKNNFTKVNLYLVSERNLSERIQELNDKKHINWTFSYHVWDISRFYRQYISRGSKEDLIVNFYDFYGKGLPCLPAHLNNDDYQSYLAVLPAEILSDLYSKYGARLLEQNVRCFLQARGQVNKGIRGTIINKPQMFFAYNNGITATAKEVITEQSSKGLFIKEIKDFQIVNGGQTTASLFHTNRKDKAPLEQVFIQMKLSVVDEDKSEEMVPAISQYANTQNKVSAADFFSNHPFHIRMEEFSRRILAPAQHGAVRESKWFYERARGQYADAQSNMSQAERKKFQIINPKPQMFTKTDMAKFENVWDEKPTIVNFGAQKNFAKYAERIGKAWEKNSDHFNEFYYKCVIARAIIFRRAEKIISRQSWYGGYRANIIAYTLALISEYCKTHNKSLNLLQIWSKQDISEATISALEAVGKIVSDDISEPPEGFSNISEWCKKDACWQRLFQKLDKLSKILPEEFVSELIAASELDGEGKTAVKIQKTDNNINDQTRVLKIGSEGWKKALKWGIDNRLFSGKDVDIIKVAIKKLPSSIPSTKQCEYLMKTLTKLEEDGFMIKY